MKKTLKQALTALFFLTMLLGCSNRSNATSSGMEEKFQTAVPMTDVNKSLMIKIMGEDNAFHLGSNIELQIENKSTHFLYFNTSDKNYMKLFMLKDDEWVEVKDRSIRSGSRVLSPQGTPLLNLDAALARPILDDTIFKNNKADVLIRIMVTGEIMKMDAYSSDWHNHEKDVLTGEFVSAYVDVHIIP